MRYFQILKWVGVNYELFVFHSLLENFQCDNLEIWCLKKHKWGAKEGDLMLPFASMGTRHILGVHMYMRVKP